MNFRKLFTMASLGLAASFIALGTTAMQPAASAAGKRKSTCVIRQVRDINR